MLNAAWIGGPLLTACHTSSSFRLLELKVSVTSRMLLCYEGRYAATFSQFPGSMLSDVGNVIRHLGPARNLLPLARSANGMIRGNRVGRNLDT